MLFRSARAREALLACRRLAALIGTNEPPAIRDIAGFPEVIRVRGAEELDLEREWKDRIEPALSLAAGRLLEMRETEGANLAKILLEQVRELRKSIEEIAQLRKSSEAESRRRITERVASVLEAHALPSVTEGAVDSDAWVRQLLESRVAQELALIIDRTDIHEELGRFEGHLSHFEKTIAEAGAVGRKLEFLLQELGREINTLGTKAQDLGISGQVIAVKVRLEQLREQVLNLE
mgnify:CR=1 FL=1